MKTILIATLLATTAPAADAGDWSFGISLGSHKRVDLRVRRHRVIAPTHHRVFVPGHYDTVQRAVHVPAVYERRYFRAKYGFRYDECRNRIRFVIRPAGHRNVLVRAAHTDYVTKKRWVPGYWKTVHQAPHRRVIHHGRGHHGHHYYDRTVRGRRHH